jgi:hypothetical protein
MENGPSLHYNRNTLNTPHPGAKRLRKNRREQHTIEFDGKIPQNREHKVVAVSRCVWCSFTAQQYFITCPICKNCQYCGMVDNVDPYRCFLCGNYLPEELRTAPVKISGDFVNNVIAKTSHKGYGKKRGNATIKSVKL